MFSSFKLGSEVKPPVRTGYFAEVRFMHGDADHYTLETFPVKPGELLEFANFLQTCSETESESAGGPGYCGIKGYEKFGQDFPYDITCEGFPASLESYEFKYFVDGREYCVILEN